MYINNITKKAAILFSILCGSASAETITINGTSKDCSSSCNFYISDIKNDADMAVVFRAVFGFQGQPKEIKKYIAKQTTNLSESEIILISEKVDKVRGNIYFVAVGSFYDLKIRGSYEHKKFKNKLTSLSFSRFDYVNKLKGRKLVRGSFDPCAGVRNKSTKSDLMSNFVVDKCGHIESDKSDTMASHMLVSPEIAKRFANLPKPFIDSERYYYLELRPVLYDVQKNRMYSTINCLTGEGMKPACVKNGVGGIRK